MKKVKKLIFKIALVGLAGYIVFVFANQCLKIQKKNEELSDINRQIAAKKDENQKIKDKLESKNTDEPQNKGSGTQSFGTIVFENVTE